MYIKHVFCYPENKGELIVLRASFAQWKNARLPAWVQLPADAFFDHY